MLDLDALQKDTHTFTLVTPDGRVHDGVEITVRSADHELVKKTNHALILKSEQRRAMAKRRGKKDTDPLTEEDLEYLEESGLTRAVSRVVSIKGLAVDGKEIGSDPEMIGKAFTKYGWLLTLVMEEADDAVNFCS